MKYRFAANAQNSWTVLEQFCSAGGRDPDGVAKRHDGDAASFPSFGGGCARTDPTQLRYCLINMEFCTAPASILPGGAQGQTSSGDYLTGL